VIRPEVILFGEEIPPDAMAQSRDAILASHSLLVVGTSAQVWPAAGLPRMALQQGAPVIEVNLEETPITRDARISIRGNAGEVLPELVRHVRALRGR
jgi:NAD-dependent deacetylase